MLTANATELTDVLTGVLQNDYDEKAIRAERAARDEGSDPVERGDPAPRSPVAASHL